MNGCVSQSLLSCYCPRNYVICIAYPVCFWRYKFIGCVESLFFFCRTFPEL